MAGNCGELSKLSAKILSASNAASGSQNLPVSIARYSGDHTYVLLGDPRETSEKEVVVVDTWPVFASAHTLDRNYFYGLNG